MTYWDEKQYWADASTRNCVWLFQIKEISRNCDCVPEGEDDVLNCHHEVISWRTENVFLTKKEAVDWGESRPYEWGKEREGWRAYGVPCCGLMAEILGRHSKEFQKKVDCINKPVGKDEVTTPHSPHE